MRKSASLVTIATVVIAASVPVLAKDRPGASWTGKATSHFAVFAADGENGGTEILGRLETARVFFERTGLAAQGTPQLNILSLSSASDPEIYHLNPAAYAFYQRTRQGDFVVMRDLASAHHAVAVHEYTHFVVEHAGLKLPLWLNEGMADLYSTVEAHKSEVIVGTAPTGRLDTLNNSRWMELGSLMAVDHDSPYYRQADKMLLFYAQSWALVHMLALDGEYQGGFTKFLLAVSSGEPSDAALRTIYQKTLEQVAQDLQSYVSSKRMAARVFNIDVRTAAPETIEIPDAGRRVEFALADIMSVNQQVATAAARRLTSLATKYPDDPRSEELLGFQAMSAGRQKDAIEHFGKAVQRNSQNPEVWFRLAHLKLEEGGASEEVVDLLQRVIAADGEHYGARLELGFAAAKQEKYEIAVNALEGISNVKPEHAYVVSYTLAYCLVEVHQGNKARMYAERAGKVAGNNRDKDEVAGLMRYIEQESPVEVASR